jgi:hypothetical protein
VFPPGIGMNPGCGHTGRKAILGACHNTTNPQRPNPLFERPSEIRCRMEIGRAWQKDTKNLYAFCAFGGNS